MKSTITYRQHESQQPNRRNFMQTKLAAAALIALLAVVFTGCACVDCEYRLTMPDTAGIAGMPMPVVARLTRHEILTIHSSVKNQPLTIQFEDTPMRAAFTDNNGYVSALVTLPENPGICELNIIYQDIKSVQARWKHDCLAIPADSKIIVVDFDSIRRFDKHKISLINKLQKSGYVIFYARRGAVGPSERYHKKLKAAKLVDSVILGWDFDSGKVAGPLAILADQSENMYYIANDKTYYTSSDNKKFIKMIQLLGLKAYIPAATGD